MKYILIIFLFIGFTASSQNYNDSTITLQLTQRAAVYIGYAIKQQFSWTDRTAPASLKNYINNGTNLDSLFTVTLKAGYIKSMVELLMSTADEIVRVDRLSIINNSPSIPSYTALATQITTKAAGNTSEKQVAQFILNYYNQRVTEFAAVRTENINSVVTWSKN